MPDDTGLRPPLDSATIVARYDGRAPRYTSYPTALQFTAAVDEPVYREWLAALRPDEAISLYVHIPLCSRLCWYCGCNTRVAHKRETIGDYVRLLLEEARLLSAALPAGVAVGSLHLGGGTPNILDAGQLNTLMGGLKSLFRFSPGCEIAAELDPADLTEDWVKAAASHGLKRASLGVQTFDANVQAVINRREGLDHVARCMGWLREAGVGSINVDLMYGLPCQTTEAVLATIESLLPLRPDRVALFGYAHVPWMKPHQKLMPADALPDAGQRLEQSEAGASRLLTKGYVQVGLDHFALPEDELAVALASGRLRRNFQGYTADAIRTILGLGVSAISSVPQGYAQNTPQEVAWRNVVKSGHLPIARGLALTDDDVFRAEIIERLMCDLHVDLAAICERHGRCITDLGDLNAALRPFMADGLATFDGKRLEVTEAGRVVLRAIAAIFDAHWTPTAAGHSKTL